MAPIIEVSDDYMKELDSNKYTRKFDLERDLEKKISASYSAVPNKEEKYLKGKTGRIFNRAENTPEGSFFKMFDKYNDTAQFDFCGDEAEAIAKRIFSDDICNIVSGGYPNANSVRTNPGKIKHIDDKWEVAEPIEVFLERR